MTDKYSSVSGFSDDKVSSDPNFDAEMNRRLIVRRLMRDVMKPLVLELPEAQVCSKSIANDQNEHSCVSKCFSVTLLQMLELQVFVKEFMMHPPSSPASFPWTLEGETLVAFVRKVCIEHSYEEIQRSLDALFLEEGGAGFGGPSAPVLLPSMDRERKGVRKFKRTGPQTVEKAEDVPEEEVKRASGDEFPWSLGLYK